MSLIKALALEVAYTVAQGAGTRIGEIVGDRIYYQCEQFWMRRAAQKPKRRKRMHK